MKPRLYDVQRGLFQTGEERPAFRTDLVWDELKVAIAADSPLLARFPAEELRKRWLEGMAIIGVDLTRIVAYTSLVQVPLDLPDTETRVYEASSGWTLPGWRRRGFQVRMRRELYKDKGNALMISFCVGIGASFVLRQLGWQLYSWPDHLGVSDFIGKVEGGFLHHRLGDAINLGGRKPFRMTDPIDLDKHDWNRYLHLWVSDVAKAAALRERILTYNK